jgi:hypothetical protein
MRHCRVDVVPTTVIRTLNEPDPIVPEKNNVALAVTTKYHPFVAWTTMPLFPGDFCFAQGASLAAPQQSTVFRQRSPTSRGDRESLSGPSPSVTLGDRISRHTRHPGVCSACPPGHRRN